MKTIDNILDIIAATIIFDIEFKRFKRNKGLTILMTNIAYDMIMKGEY